ncbi:DUF6538 domain-containing protein [Rhodobium gokarnense]|uniref:Integrase n=1 Tax=Rhodobium gokarnense TaxID=364296 RepID=A0ABT3HEP2_9HYPH|nr:DUF6538 domain-containing protein [Rhodobium gokarnense]MCW2308868.1 integrase [Rhodobium gokarnense]
MKDMPKHPRLTKRGDVYWHRASVPVDIRATYPKTEEIFSLGTRDPQEALRLVRKAAVEVDERFAAHRRHLAQMSQPPLAELTQDHLQRLEEAYFAHLLDEDEEVRLDGFFEEGGPASAVPVPTFEERIEGSAFLAAGARHELARGKSDAFYRDEADEVLSWDGLGIRLAPSSPSWKLATRAIQRAIVRAQQVIEARDRGDVVDTPVLPTLPVRESVSASCSLASEVRKDWIAEKSKAAWVDKTRREHEVWSQHLIDLVGDRPIDQYVKADGRRFKLALQKLPPNWNKQVGLKELTFAKAAEKAGALGLAPMSDKNINKIIAFVGSFFNWAAGQYDEVKSNPVDKLKIKIRSRARDDRDPFSMNQLRAMFAAPLYTGCRSAYHWSRPGDEVLSDSGRYWVPLISLYSGARMGEIIQLRTEDVGGDAGVTFFILTAEHDDQRLKTANAHRRIPAHPELVELGLLQWSCPRFAGRSGYLVRARMNSLGEHIRSAESGWTSL